MHLSHIHEDMLAWYLNHDHGERVDAMFRPGLEVAPARQTLSQPPGEAVGADELRRDFARHQRIGHAGAIQSASRLQRDVVGRDGTLYPKGTAVPLRADFNTLDNPFAWSADPGVTQYGTNRPAAFTSSSSTRPPMTSGEFVWRWTACCPTERGSHWSRVRAPRGSTPCSSPLTGRTSSSHHALTGPSRSPS